MAYFNDQMKKKSIININLISEEIIDPELEKELEKYLYDEIMYLVSYCWDNKFGKPQIEEWLSNFKGEIYSVDKERNIALLLLLNFVYYNVREVKHLCKELFENYLHKAIYCNSMDINNDSKEVIDGTFFFPLGNPSESGSQLMYYFRTENKIPKDKFRYDLKDALFNDKYKGKNIIVMDDVTLTGSQAIEYINSAVESHYESTNSGMLDCKRRMCKVLGEKLISDRKVYVLLLVADKKAIENIKEELKYIIEIEVISSIELDKRSKGFSDNSYIFNGNHKLKKVCEEFASHYGEKLCGKDHCLGFRNSELLMGFFYNIPDNTLPIFWDKRNNWSPIFERADKIYNENYAGVLENDKTIQYI